MTFREIDMTLIDEPVYAHRISIDPEEVQELADSIAEHGLKNPPNVHPEGPRFRIDAGHKRFLAHRLLNRSRIMCNIAEGNDAAANSATTFIENFHRSGLSPIEEALAMQHEMNVNKQSAQQISRVVRRPPQFVVDRLALLDFPDDLKMHIHNGDIAISSARALARCTDDEHRKHLTHYCLTTGANTNTIISWVTTWAQSIADNPGAPVPMPTIPAAGQELIIEMPCFGCSKPCNYKKMMIVRMCPELFENGKGRVPCAINQ